MWPAKIIHPVHGTLPANLHPSLASGPTCWELMVQPEHDELLDNTGAQHRTASQDPAGAERGCREPRFASTTSLRSAAAPVNPAQTLFYFQFIQGCAY